MKNCYEEWRMSDEEWALICECEPVVNAEFEEFSGESPSEVIVEAVAAAAGVDPLELPPLYEYVDPESVDTLVDGHHGAAEPLLTFEMDSWKIFVRAEGDICVCDRTRPVEPRPVFEGTTP